MKRIAVFLIWMVVGQSLSAQIKVGDNPSNISSNAAIEIESTNKGFLLPRMTLAQMNAINAPTQGLMVFVTDDNCTYVYNGAKWKSNCSANVNAVISSGTLSCAGTLNGDYVSTVDMTTSNTKVISFTLTGAGDYICYTDTVNGVYFRSEGTIAAGGTGSITMRAYGNPNYAGANTFTVKMNGMSCTFSVTFANPPSTVLNGAINCSGSLLGSYKVGNVMIAANNYKTITVTPTSVGYYNYTTGPVNGVTFSASGVFNSGQLNTLQSIDLIASGTPINQFTTGGDSFTYTVSGTNISSPCSFKVGFQDVKYLLAYPFSTSTQTFSSPGDISWTTMKSNGITCNGTEITLKAGKTYEILARPAFMNGVIATYNIVNTSNSILSGSTTGYYANNSYNTARNNGEYATCIYTVTGTTDVKIKVRITLVFSGTTVTVRNNYGSLIVKEISSNLTYALGGINTNQTFTTQGTDVTFNQLSNNSASISGTGITLKANKTYILKCQLSARTNSNNQGDFKFEFVNQGNNKLTGTHQGSYTSANQAWGFKTTANKIAGGIYTVGTSDQVVKVRITLIASGETYILDANQCFVSAIEIPSTNYYMAASAPATSTSVNNNYNVSWGAFKNSGVTGSGTAITLRAGRTYLIRSEFRTLFNNSSGDALTYGLFDLSNGVWLNNVYGWTVNVMSTNSWNNGEVCTSIVTVGSSDITIQLRVSSVTGSTASTMSDEAYLDIEEL